MFPHCDMQYHSIHKTTALVDAELLLRCWNSFSPDEISNQPRGGPFGLFPHDHVGGYVSAFLIKGYLLNGAVLKRPVDWFL